MRFIIILTAAIFVNANAYSQGIPASQIEAINKVSFMEGKWEGKGWVTRGPGPKIYFNQTEDIKMNLKNSIMEIEGIGTSAEAGNNNMVVHHAKAILRYDHNLKKYRMHSFNDGNYIEADAEVNDDGQLIWGFKIQQYNMHIRFTISLNDKGQWFEIGEYSMDGKNWQKNFEMTLNKVESK